MHRRDIEYIIRKLHYFKTERKDDSPVINPTGEWWMTSCVLSRWTHEKKSEFHVPMDYNPSMGIKEETGSSVAHCFSCKHTNGLLNTINEFAHHAIPEGLMTKEEHKDLLSYAMLAEEDDTEIVRPSFVTQQEPIPEAILQCLGEIHDEEAANYLEKRGFTGEDVELFKIGYSSSHERIMFPIISYNGDISVVQGRILGQPSSDTPKYKNYPKNVKKQNYLYGEHLVTEDTKIIVLVEGQADVVKGNQYLRKHGYSPEYLVLGVMGSELSQEQTEKLKGWAKEVIPFGDNDSPGKLMNKKAQDVLKNYMQVGIIQYPEGTEGADPDSLGDRFIDILDKRKNYLQFKLEMMFRKGVKP